MLYYLYWIVLLCIIHIVHCSFVFFFKQNTAYEMRISDCSSDVCSSDLIDPRPAALDEGRRPGGGVGWIAGRAALQDILGRHGAVAGERGPDHELGEIGRASCRERVCQYV